MTQKLQGKVALVVGGASGIGRAISECFHAEGATVALADFNLEACRQVADHLGARVTTHGVDVSDEEAVKVMVGDVVKAHRTIDVLVNCAGILDETPLLEMSTETFDRMIGINLRGVFLVSRQVAPHMVERKRGRIINISSQLALKGGVGLAHYCSAKAGVLGLTKAMAHELAPFGVLTNAIAPGPILTPMLEGLSQQWIADKEAELPLGRFGKAEEVAPTALMLAASPDGDLYVGQTLGPNSGDVM
ncbi:3-oxoacyl-[acyl-carrier protein] reductase [Chromohalobacter canadensis]|uniref:3-oxoacyl-[acyl-carrier protein] reductase n=1 Tax=Chromohalobacter canadensis TaxID=141389 RepID=A0A285VKW4_9GAMM|nr:3-oxoacyl-ACP reductase family protein [Chromohalobacter canadensis]SOC54699.1 3-oxoacyl-[acyl-carrier protein] reductase [Chromohalobacter canadensis]